LAKLRPEESEERYMSRRPALSCWRMGRSERGIVAPPTGDVIVAAPPVGDRVAECEFIFTMPERGIVGFEMAEEDLETADAAVGRGGWPIGVS
jgi:hypothetical protein